MKTKTKINALIMCILMFTTFICNTNVVSAEQQSESISVSRISDQIYTGNPITPDVNIVNSCNEPLVFNKDYTLSYKDNINVGIASVTVTGKNNYSTFEKIYNFNIVPRIDYTRIYEYSNEIEISKICTLNVLSSVKPLYTSTNPDVATISQNGTIHPLKEGVTYITVNACNGTNLPIEKGSKTIKIIVSYFIVGSQHSSMVIGDSTKLAVELTDLDGKINWSSSNKNIINVESNGNIVALKEGKATIVATVTGDILAKVFYEFEVDYPITKKAVELSAGKKVTIDKQEGIQGKLKFKSNNPKIATVNKDGTVLGIKKGNTTVVVTRNNVNILVPIKVTTNPKIENNRNINEIIILNKKKINISGKVGIQSFRSLNNKVATINNNGIITAKNIGTTIIKVKTNGINLSYKVRVIKPIIKNLDSKNTISVSLKRSKLLKIIGQVSGNNNKPKLIFNNNKIAKYLNGKIIGKKIGRTKVNIRINGIWQQITVNVTK